jgi:hypothetical protein
MPIDDTDLDTPIYGVGPISRVVNLDARRTYYRLEKGYIPATKIGKTWATTKRRLRDRLNETLKPKDKSEQAA